MGIRKRQIIDGPRVYRKASNQATITTAVDVTGLESETLEVNEMYRVTGSLIADSTATTTSPQIAFEVPTGATILGDAYINLNTSAGNLTVYPITASGTFVGPSGTWPTSTPSRTYQVVFTLIMGGTAGTVKARAQRSGGAGSITIEAGSHLIVEKL